MRYLILLVMMGLMGGCSAKWSDSGHGMIEYPSLGPKWIIEYRKESARRLMEKYCMPNRHKVIRTWNILLVGEPGIFNRAPSQRKVYIDFECTEEELTSDELREMKERHDAK